MVLEHLLNVSITDALLTKDCHSLGLSAKTAVTAALVGSNHGGISSTGTLPRMSVTSHKFFRIVTLIGRKSFSILEAK